MVNKRGMAAKKISSKKKSGGMAKIVAAWRQTWRSIISVATSWHQRHRSGSEMAYKSGRKSEGIEIRQWRRNGSRGGEIIGGGRQAINVVAVGENAKRQQWVTSSALAAWRHGI